MKLSDFDYSLADTYIANKPSSPRDSCKLLVVNNTITDDRFYNLVSYLKKGDVLVLNKTKVLHAKIIGKKSTGSIAELIFIKKISKKKYLCKIKTKNPHIGTKILFENGVAEITGQENIDTFIVSLTSNKILSKATFPQPPYIKRKISESEYQTVFSKDPGSLAAPTAGLHFTNRLLKKITSLGVKIVFITLHVSYGTFKNISGKISEFVMDKEWFEISKKSASVINSRKGRLFVVGTTTLKALESSSKNGKILPFKGYSDLFIYPPFKFNSGADALITNFHLPKSSLLLLTSAFYERKKLLSAYDYAIKNNYKFYSLGDAMLIFRAKNL